MEKVTFGTVNGCLSVILILCLWAMPINASDGALEKSTQISKPPAWPPDGQLFELYFTRDTGLSSVDGESDQGRGSSKILKVKGQQEFVLFDVDTSQLQGKIISGAELVVRSASPDEAPLSRIGVSSIAHPWVEGKSMWLISEKGTSTFNQAEHQKNNWSYPESSLMDVSFGRGNTIWRFSDCTQPDPDGWQACAVDPDVIAAHVSGLSYGFVIADEVGSEWSVDDQINYKWFPNRTFFSRENRTTNRPLIRVWLSGEDSQGPKQISSFSCSTESLPAGQAVMRWTTPEDVGSGHTLGFKVTYLHNGTPTFFPAYLTPMATAPGETLSMHIQDLPFEAGETIQIDITPVDSAGNHGIPFSTRVKLSYGVNLPVIPASINHPFPPNSSLPEVKGVKISVVDLLDKINPQTGAMIPPHIEGYKGGNHLYSASKRMIQLQGAKNETIHFQVNLSGHAENISVDYFFNDSPDLHPKLYKFSHVQTRDNKGSNADILPDPLIPITKSDTFSIPNENSLISITDQQNTSAIAELYIPHQVSSGNHQGKLLVTANGQPLSFIINLKVWDFTLPNKLSFVPEMNAYGTVSPYQSYDFYKLAHEHRTCINRLPYGWDGKPAFAPQWDEETEEFNWQKWDEKIGPLLDGSAFIGLPRSGEPVDNFYLPLNENWPVTIAQYFSPSYWVEEAVDKTYQEKLGRAMAKFAAHLNQKSWHQTNFQFYLNNKVTYRSKFSQSSAPWLFDEPVNTQDFWALRWYGLLWRSAVRQFGRKIKADFRADISYSQFSRNILWGITDIEYLGGTTAQKIRMQQSDKILGRGGSFAEYGSANPIQQPNTQPVLWCLSAWSKGAKGVLPWQTIGTRKSWQSADQNALFYPSKNGPRPSVRLKAFTRGQQDVEYLTMLSEIYSLPRFIIAQWLDNQLPLKRLTCQTKPNGTATPPLNTMTTTQLWSIRNRIGNVLSQHAPKYNRSFLPEVLTSQEKDSIASIGYVTVAPEVASRKPIGSLFSQKNVLH